MPTITAWIADTRVWYTVLVAAVGVQRLLELRLARRNTAALRSRRAVEVGRGHLPAMIAMHVLWLVACPFETWWFARPFVVALAIPCAVLFALAQALRYWAITALGNRWTIRVMAIPGTLTVVRGPYRYIRHPNYLAVIVEIVTLPLIHTAWITALAFSAANAALLAVRIRSEERLLRQVGSYGAALEGRPRFVPRA